MPRFADFFLQRRQQSKSNNSEPVADDAGQPKNQKYPRLNVPRPSALDVPYLSVHSSSSSTTGSVRTPSSTMEDHERDAFLATMPSSPQATPKAVMAPSSATEQQSLPSTSTAKWKSVLRGSFKKGRSVAEPFVHVETATGLVTRGDDQALDVNTVRKMDSFRSPYGVNDGGEWDEQLSPPIPPFLRMSGESRRNDSKLSGSSAYSPTSSLRSSRSSLVVPQFTPPASSTSPTNETTPMMPRDTLRALFSSAMVAPLPSAHPLESFSSPSSTTSVFPRSVLLLSSYVSRPPTLLQSVLRKSLVHKLHQGTFILTADEERALHALASRISIPTKPVSHVRYAGNLSPPNGWSDGLIRWADREGYEERNVVYFGDITGDIDVSEPRPISGGAIAALEFSDGLEALAGFRGLMVEGTVAPFAHTLEVETSSDDLPDPRLSLSAPLYHSSSSPFIPPVSTPLFSPDNLIQLPASASPAPSQSSISAPPTPLSSTLSALHSSNDATPIMIPPVPPKRGVRFAPSIGTSSSDNEGDRRASTIPRVVVRPSSSAGTASPSRAPQQRRGGGESRVSRVGSVKQATMSAHHLAVARERAAQLEILERARQVQAREEALERERKRQARLQEARRLREEVAATRKRRESYYGHDGGSASPRALNSLGVSAWSKGDADVMPGAEDANASARRRRHITASASGPIGEVPAPRRTMTDLGGPPSFTPSRPASLGGPPVGSRRVSNSPQIHGRHPSGSSPPIRPASVTGDVRRHSSTDVVQTRSSASAHGHGQGRASIPPRPSYQRASVSMHSPPPVPSLSTGYFGQQQQMFMSPPLPQMPMMGAPQGLMPMPGPTPMLVMMQPVYVMSPTAVPVPFSTPLPSSSSSRTIPQQQRSFSRPTISHSSHQTPSSSSLRNQYQQQPTSSHPAESARSRRDSMGVSRQPVVSSPLSSSSSPSRSQQQQRRTSEVHVSGSPVPTSGASPAQGLPRPSRLRSKFFNA